MVNSQVALTVGRSTLLCRIRVEAKGRAGERTEEKKRKKKRKKENGIAGSK